MRFADRLKYIGASVALAGLHGIMTVIGQRCGEVAPYAFVKHFHRIGPMPTCGRYACHLGPHRDSTWKPHEPYETATCTALDGWGERFGVKRSPTELWNGLHPEPDDHYRERIRKSGGSAYAGFPPGQIEWWS